MAQAARPLPSPRATAPGRHLHSVPALRGPAPPSAQVIRRRRLSALAGLAAVVALALAWLAVSGPAPGDTARITTLLKAGAADPAELCDHLSARMLQAVGGHDACLAASPVRSPGGVVRHVRVSGASATAVVSRAGGSESVRLVRQDGDWKVDDVR